MSGVVNTSTGTPVCTIDAAGIHVPTYQDVLAYLVQQYQSIYGSDVYLGPDSQDGQWISVIALAISDANSMCAAAYASFSPATAFGAGLSSVVKINNITRLIPTNSMVDLDIGGQNGTTITNGIARDVNQNNWLLPPTVTIPASGVVTVTALAASSGQISAAAGTITTIATPTRGWQTVTNKLAALPGDPVESDAALRQRQTVSTALPSQALLDGIVGDISSIPGVVRAVPYENDTNATDTNGVPAHSVAFVVDGGDAKAIADAIALKKTPGTGTYGTTVMQVTDTEGNVNNIAFFRPSLVPITVAITVDPQFGYATATTALIAQALADYISSLPIGGDVFLSKLYTPANLSGAVGNTFNITSLRISRGGTPPTAADVPIAFNEAAVCSVNNIVTTVLAHT